MLGFSWQATSLLSLVLVGVVDAKPMRQHSDHVQQLESRAAAACNKGFVRINNKCTPCSTRYPNSLTCSTTAALTCKTGYAVTKGACSPKVCPTGTFKNPTDGKCLKTCPTTTFGDTKSKTCKPCTANTLTCSATTSLSCDSKAFLIGGRCAKSCPQGKFSDTKKRICTSCPEFARTCSSPTVATSCYSVGDDEYVLVNGKCTKPARTCKPGQFAHDGCTDCKTYWGSGVVTCDRTGPNTCGFDSNGQPTFFIVDGDNRKRCYKNCPVYQFGNKLTNKCEACGEGAYYCTSKDNPTVCDTSFWAPAPGNKCVPCADGVEYCDFKTGAINSCKPKNSKGKELYYLEDQDEDYLVSCVTQCPAKTIKVERNGGKFCDFCVSRERPVNGVCQKTVCKQGEYNLNGDCVSCGEGVSTCDEYGRISECGQNSAGDLFYLKNEYTCVADCGPGEFGTLNPQKCAKCMYTFPGSIECTRDGPTECEDGYEVDEAKNECVRAKPVLPDAPSFPYARFQDAIVEWVGWNGKEDYFNAPPSATIPGGNFSPSFCFTEARKLSDSIPAQDWIQFPGRDSSLKCSRYQLEIPGKVRATDFGSAALLPGSCEDLIESNPGFKCDDVQLSVNSCIVTETGAEC